jgi:4-amino-4-deoxy-L-arabinose transferase-like glycosyltransferase
MKRSEKFYIFAIFFLLFTFTANFKDSVVIPDEEYLIKVAQNIAEGKSLSLPEGFPYNYNIITKTGIDGNKYSAVPIGQSLVIAPFYFLFDKISKIFFNGSFTTQMLYLIPLIFSALTILLFYIFCLRLKLSRTVALISSSMLAFGTIIWPYSKYMLAESTQAFLLLAFIYLIFIQLKDRRPDNLSSILAGLSLGLLAIIKPVFIILVPASVVLFILLRKTDRKLYLPFALILISFCAVFCIQLFYNLERFGGLFDFGYSDNKGFSTPLHVGLYGLLFSSGKSFFLYSPITILLFFGLKDFFKSFKNLAILVFTIVILTVLIYSKWFVWGGDFSWGPRFLVPLVPLAMLPASFAVKRISESARRIPKYALLLLFTLSLFVQTLAISVHYLAYLNYFKAYVSPIPPYNTSTTFREFTGKLELRDNYIDYEFIPEFSPLAGQFWIVRSLLSDNPDSFDKTPWHALGLNRYYKKTPLKAEFDFWLASGLTKAIDQGNYFILLPLLTLICLTAISVTMLRRYIKRNGGFDKPIN